MRKAEGEVTRGEYPSAVATYQSIIDRDPESELALEAARRGAQVAHLQSKQYTKAVKMYEHIIFRSNDPEERKTAQRYLAQIYFENIGDCDQAILAYERLLRLKLSDEDILRFRLNVAKCHYKLANMDQASAEVDSIISQFPKRDEVYDAKVLKSNILLSQKKNPEAITILDEVIEEFPDRSKKEDLGIILVSTYEDMKEFDKAIQKLEAMREGYDHPEFLDMRIKTLKERRTNQPGAQGWKR